MTQQTTARWRAFPALVAVVALGMGLTALAQFGGEQKAGHQDPQVAKAKEMAELIRAGQLNLRDATSVAEKHCQGIALEAVGQIRTEGTAMRGAPQGGDKPQDDQPQSSGKRVVYEVRCLAEDEIRNVFIDGLTKKPMETSGNRPSGYEDTRGPK